MSEAPTFSVVMPAYNRAYIIGDAIRSVLAQTFIDFELVIVDDGSSDDTQVVVESFGDSRIRYVCHSRNSGCSAAYNTGFRTARGQLVSILDSDDFWKPEKLARDIEFLQRNPKIDAVFTDVEKFDGSSRQHSFVRTTPILGPMLADKGYPSEVCFEQREMYHCLLVEVPVKPSTLTLRRRALEEVGYFNEDWPSGSDWEFLLRFARRFRFGYVDTPMTVMRVQTDATHRRHLERDHALILELLRAEAGRLRRIGDFESYRAACRGLSEMTKHLAWYYEEQGRRSKAASTFTRGFLWSRDSGLILRAFGVFVPQSLRSRLRRSGK